MESLSASNVCLTDEFATNSQAEPDVPQIAEDFTNNSECNISDKNNLKNEPEKCMPSYSNNSKIFQDGSEMVYSDNKVTQDNDIEILDGNISQSNVFAPDNDIEIVSANIGQSDVALDNDIEILDNNIGQSDHIATDNDIEILDNNSGQSDHIATDNEIEILDNNIGQSDHIAPDDNIEILDDNIGQSESLEIEYDFTHVPYQVTGSWKEFSSAKRNNFTRGCKWAPDGSCILTCSDDNILRIFNLPQQFWDSSPWQDISEMEAVVKISEGEIIYDYSWYPLMNSSDPATCCLASSSKNSTVHLWDGFTGELRGSYRTYNHMDEIVTPHSLSFDVGGQKLFCGFEKIIRIFDVDTPGREFDERYIFAQKVGQSGIISCFAFTPTNTNISAVGTYHKTIGLYSETSGNLECILEGQKGGITQLHFSPDGTCLYSGGRKDPEILCWDLRNLGSVLFSLRRLCTTNQRMYFDISRCGKYVISGNQNGVITIWDVTKEAKVVDEDEFSVMEPIQFFLAHDDCVNGISLHPSLPLLCSSSGQRKFPSLLSDDDEEMFSCKIEKSDNSLRLWWVGKT